MSHTQVSDCRVDAVIINVINYLRSNNMKRIIITIAVIALTLGAAVPAHASEAYKARRVSADVAIDQIGPLTAKSPEARVTARAAKCRRVKVRRYRCPVRVSSDAMVCQTTMVTERHGSEWWTWGRNVTCTPR